MRTWLTAIVLCLFTPLVVAQPPITSDKEAQAQLDRYFRQLTKEIADRALADVKSLDDWTKQRDQRRRELAEMLGLWPTPEKTDLQTTVTGTVDAGEFVVEKVHFQSRPKLYVTANFYRPKVVDKPLPTILYACGHGNVKIDGVSYGAKANYQHHPAWFARNGYCCLILDTLQLGEIEGEHHGTYRNNKWWWISRGYTPAGVEAWNCIRAIDYLETRPEVDKTKIGMTGRSGGGAYTWWTAALDDRIACLVPVAGITDLENHVVDGCIEGHCDCMYMVNTYQWDFATVAALAAPRPLLIANTDKDIIFPLNGVYRIHQKVKRLYDLHKAGDKLGLLITEGGHNDSQELQVPTFQWFNRFLKNDKGPITKLAEKLLDPKQLKVFDKLPEDQRNTTVDEWFVPAAPTPVPKSLGEWERQRGRYRVDLREKVFRNWPRDPPLLDVRVISERVVEGLLTQVLDFHSEGGLRPLIFLMRPAKQVGPLRIEVALAPADDWSNTARHLSLFFGEFIPGRNDSDLDKTWCKNMAEAWARSGEVQATLVVRMSGPSSLDPENKRDIQLLRRFPLLGRTLEDGQIWDTLRALAALRSHERYVDKTALRGLRHVAPIALYAGVLDNGVDSVDVGRLNGRHANGPPLLGISKVCDFPQAVALVFPRDITIHFSQPPDWNWSNAVSDFYASKPRGRRPLILHDSPWMVDDLPPTIEIMIETALGMIEVIVDVQNAPQTSRNFLTYALHGSYHDGDFHRVVRLANQVNDRVKIDVVQARMNQTRLTEVRPPITLERTSTTGLKHLDGTISMARDGPDTATSDFFICIGDQPELNYGGKRNPDGQGFAAFGRVVKGMDVVRKIHQAPADGQKLTPPVKIISIKRKN